MAPMKKKWSEHDTLKFVELYEAEEVLWNVKLKDYKNKDARNAAIQRIIENINIDDFTPQDVSVKINNIRSTYSQEKNKIKKSSGTGSGTHDINYVPSLAWFEVADRFLSGVIKSRKTFQNVDDSSESLDMSASSTQKLPLPDMPAGPFQDTQANHIIDIHANPADMPQKSSRSPQPAGPSSRKRMTLAMPQHNAEAIREQAKDNRELDDEFSHFGRNIACQLRQLPIIDALEVQSEILKLIKNRRQAVLHLEARNSLHVECYMECVPQHILPNVKEENLQD